MIKKFCLILTLVIFSTLKSVYAEEIKVGVMLHLGGDFAAWGQAYLEGAQLAQEQVNAKDGIKGKKLELIVEDIRFDPRMTASATKKLLEVDRVPVAIISTFTEVMVAGPIFERAKVPLVVIGDSGEELDAMGDYIFSTGSWVKGYAVSASGYFTKKLNLKKVAVIATNNPWSQTTADTFTKDFQVQGGTVTVREDLNPQESDFRSVLRNLKSKGVDGIFAPITANSIPFFKQASDLELTMPIMTAGGALDHDVILAAPKATEGRYVTDTFLDHSRGAAATMLELYQSKFNKLPNYPSVTGRGYDGLLTVIQALENAKSFTSEDIKDALYKVDFEGAGFHVQISEQGGAHLPVEVLEVKDGLLLKK